ncbi:MAG: hypothetical protein JNK82_26535 [Myxococcaceae bacterium]|nr:hypothetical protein [Myxococcaceae bacterium]
MSPLFLNLLLAASDPYGALRELNKQLPLDASVTKVAPVMAESLEGTDRVELSAGGNKLVVYVSKNPEPAQACPIKVGQRVKLLSAEVPVATRVEFRIVDNGRICKGRTMLTLTVLGANPAERAKAGVTREPGAPVEEREIESQRISVALGADERPLTVTPYRFDTSDKFYVAPSFGTCVFKLGDLLDVPPFQWSMCSSGTRCWATDAKTGTPCTLWSDAVQTADTLPSADPPAVRSGR